MDNDIKEPCGQCGGSGLIFFRPSAKPAFIICDLCEGTGLYKANTLWIIQGEIIFDWRSKQNLTLREASRKYNIDASNLSKMERGIIKPDPEYLRMCLALDSDSKQ